MNNNFFENCRDKQSVALRLKQLQFAKVGFYSVGLYPASLAYNCAMQNGGLNLLLAPRPRHKRQRLFVFFISQIKQRTNQRNIYFNFSILKFKTYFIYVIHRSFNTNKPANPKIFMYVFVARDHFRNIKGGVRCA